MFTLSDFDFNLPPELIAQTALAERSASRLLDVDNSTNPPAFTDRQFTELPGLLESGDLLVFNDTKVLKARFLGQKASGGRIEVLVERLTGATTALAQIRASKSPQPGTKIVLADAFERAAYDLSLNYTRPANPALSTRDAAWAEEIIRQRQI